MSITIDLCGSDYDTKVYVYNSVLNLIACNDDYYTDPYCGIYVSRLDNVILSPGETYFIIVDGYGGDAGNYVFAIPIICNPCTVPCPSGGVAEGEPPLVDGYDECTTAAATRRPDHAVPGRARRPERRCDLLRRRRLVLPPTGPATATPTGSS